ncbi:hypothetical protein MBLNU230_g7155t1 [Neophaeotheca triangularis]
MPSLFATLRAPAAVIPATLAQSPGCSNTNPSPSGLRTTEVNGQTREYTVTIPETYDPTTQHKLIINYHWLDGNMDMVVGANHYGLEEHAAGSAIFVAPNGLDAGWANVDGEDLLFTDQIIEEVEAELCVDQSQRFATGFSYGGAMTYAVACDRAGIKHLHSTPVKLSIANDHHYADTFTAVAVLAGALLSGCSAGNDAVPYLGIHGVTDDILPLDRGRELRNTFLSNNDCTGEELPTPAPGSSDYVKTEYTCAVEPVTFITWGGDHDAYPGPWAPEETWTFWEQFFTPSAGSALEAEQAAAVPGFTEPEEQTDSDATEPTTAFNDWDTTSPTEGDETPIESTDPVAEQWQPTPPSAPSPPVEQAPWGPQPTAPVDELEDVANEWEISQPSSGFQTLTTPAAAGATGDVECGVEYVTVEA